MVTGKAPDDNQGSSFKPKRTRMPEVQADMDYFSKAFDDARDLGECQLLSQLGLEQNPAHGAF